MGDIKDGMEESQLVLKKYMREKELKVSGKEG